jgi:hypothetical protein
MATLVELIFPLFLFFFSLRKSTICDGGAAIMDLSIGRKEVGSRWAEAVVIIASPKGS